MAKEYHATRHVFCSECGCEKGVISFAHFVVPHNAKRDLFDGNGVDVNNAKFLCKWHFKKLGYDEKSYNIAHIVLSQRAS